MKRTKSVNDQGNPVITYEDTPHGTVAVEYLDERFFPMRVTIDRPFVDFTDVHSVILKCWGCGPWTMTECEIDGNSAVFYSRTDYSN